MSVQSQGSLIINRPEAREGNRGQVSTGQIESCRVGSDPIRGGIRVKRDPVGQRIVSNPGRRARLTGRAEISVVREDGLRRVCPCLGIRPRHRPVSVDLVSRSPNVPRAILAGGYVYGARLRNRQEENYSKDGVQHSFHVVVTSVSRT